MSSVVSSGSASFCDNSACENTRVSSGARRSRLLARGADGRVAPVRVGVKHRKEVWKQMTPGEGGALGFAAGIAVVLDVATLAALAEALCRALLGAADRPPAATCPLNDDVGLVADGDAGRVPPEVASSASVASDTHSARPATIRAVHGFDGWSDIDMILSAYAQG
jgi:hypothetical protein